MSKTGIVLDDLYKDHDSGWGHPESAKRIDGIKDRLTSSGLLKELHPLENIPADPTVIENTHDADYIKRVEKMCKEGHPMIDSPDTGIGKQSYNIALHAVGSGIHAADKILAGEIDNAFCTVRPPGHHAEHNMALGFCLFNNIAVVARYLIQKHQLSRVMIMDYDVHHGNGTMHTFYQDPSVYYISTHQYPHYPGTGAPNEFGEGRGNGYTLNIGMDAGAGDKEYSQAFQEKVIPEIEKYKPEFILISAGFDAHADDPLAGLKLSSSMYYTMTKMLKEVALSTCNGRVLAFLEGGYNIRALGESVEFAVKALME